MTQKSKWLLRLGLGFVLFLVLVVGGHWFMGWRAEQALNRAVAEIAARGESTRAEDLRGAPIRDEENAALDLRKAARLIDAESKVWKRLDRLSPRLPLHDSEKIAARAAVQENSEALQLVREARAKRKAAWGVALRSPMLTTLLPDLREQRDLSNLVVAKMLLAHEEGDHGEVMERARDILAMGKANQEMPTLVSYLVGQGLSAEAAGRAGDAAVGLKVGTKAGEASPEQVRALIAELLDETWAKEGLVRAMQAERVMILDTIRCVRDGSMALYGPISGPKVAPAAARSVAYVGKPTMLNNAAQVTQYVGEVIGQVQSSRDWATFDQAIGARPKQSKPSMFRVASLLLPALERSTESHFRALAKRRLAAAALAVRLYAVEHDGELPPKLSDLVPKYLPAVPADPMVADRQAIRYVASGGAPMLYSVGSDGRDDGGVESESRDNPHDIVVHLKRQPREKEEREVEEADETQDAEEPGDACVVK